MGIFFSLRRKNAAYKVYLSGVVIAGFIIIMATIRNISILGADTLGSLYFPSYAAARRINIGDFLQRIEVAVTVVFMIAGFIKISVCLFAACNGIGKVFGLKSYKSVVVQVGLLMVYLAYFVYTSIMEMTFWAFKIYAYYAFPFQVIFPVLILIVAEIRIRSGSLKPKEQVAGQ